MSNVSMGCRDVWGLTNDALVRSRAWWAAFATGLPTSLNDARLSNLELEETGKIARTDARVVPCFRISHRDEETSEEGERTREQIKGGFLLLLSLRYASEKGGFLLLLFALCV